MATCADTVTPWIQRVAVVGAGPATPITFPTSTVAKTQQANGPVVLPALTDTIAAAANPNRRFLQITNVSGQVIYIAFGGAATALMQPIPNNAAYVLDVNTLGEMNRQEVHLFCVAGAVAGVTVYAE